MEEAEFVCRECGWKGSSPVVKSWSEPSSTHRGSHGEDVHVPAHSGSMYKCPKCSMMVKTQKEWESDDYQLSWVGNIWGGILIGTILLVMLISIILWAYCSLSYGYGQCS
jgi:hypothetical protein